MYDTLAEFYDGFTDAAYYDKWMRYVLSFLGGYRHGADVGCGTGYFTVELSKLGLDVVGMDNSRAMLDFAFRRAVQAGVKPKFVLGDAKRLCLPQPTEFVLAMNDVVNYMRDPAPFFRAAAQNLVRGGLLLFDVSSVYKMQNVLAGNVFTEENEHAVYVWQNSPVLKNKYVDMKLSFFKKERDGRYCLSREEQRQYLHSEIEILRLLRECGFKVRVYGDLSKRAPKENAVRIHFAAIKEE